MLEEANVSLLRRLVSEMRPLARCIRQRQLSVRCLHLSSRNASSIRPLKAARDGGDSRLKDYGKVIEDEYAAIRASYDTPKLPIVLAHGLFGFDTLRAIPSFPVHYWHGIADALQAKGVEVITAEVPPSSSIQVRAAELHKIIAAKARGRAVNIVAHSMGGLDSRYMLSQVMLDKPQSDAFQVKSLTTIASPHRGSSVADSLLKSIGPLWLPRIYHVLEGLGLSTDAFSQLTRDYMINKFNKTVLDVPGVQYYSYGASFAPHFSSVFRQSHRLLAVTEGENDGLVSVESSQWGAYKGTLNGVSHLDLINWTNRLRWWFWSMTGHQRKFNAIAFYLDIADMLAKEGL